MSLGLIGKKSGMSRLFQEDGDSIPVTLISVFGNYIADIKTEDRDGYSSVVVLKQSNNKKYLKKSHKEFFKKTHIILINVLICISEKNIFLSKIL